MRKYPNGRPEDPCRCLACTFNGRQCRRKRAERPNFKQLVPFCWQHGRLATPHTDGSYGGVKVPQAHESRVDD